MFNFERLKSTQKIMKRRELKSSIHFLADELIAECIAHLDYQKQDNFDDVDNIIKTVLLMEDDMIRRLSHVEPGSTRLFFKKIQEELTARVDDLVDQISALG